MEKTLFLNKKFFYTTPEFFSTVYVIELDESFKMIYNCPVVENYLHDKSIKNIYSSFGVSVTRHYIEKSSPTIFLILFLFISTKVAYAPKPLFFSRKNPSRALGGDF